jgi:UDP-glucose 4-epimerase
LTHFLVTGGNGFIGSHLVDRLATDKDNRVTVFDLYPRPHAGMPRDAVFIQGDVGDTPLVRRTLVDQGIEVVYHVAWAGIHETSIKDPVRDIKMNLVPSVGLLEASREAGVARVVFASSGGTVYGMPDRLPIAEDHPTHPISGYGITKLAVEHYLRMYSHLYGMPSVIVRPSVAYGPRQNPRRRQSAVTVFIYHALLGEPIIIWGDGEVTRDYIFVEDLIDALLLAAHVNTSSTSVFNLAGPRAYTLNELIREIENTLAVRMQVHYEPARRFDVPAVRLDTQAAARILKWQPDTGLPEGIKKTAAWLRQWKD